MLSLVSVPVLSVHNVSILPKFSIALIFLTNVFLVSSVLTPLDKLTLTIIGNIEGVIPTATLKENKNASK